MSASRCTSPIAIRPYLVTVPAQRTLHLRFNDLERPAPIPRDTSYSSLLESDVPIVAQHARLDSRRAEVSLALDHRLRAGRVAVVRHTGLRA